MITASAKRVFVEGVMTLWEAATTERLSRLSLPLPAHGVWNSWGFWIGVKVLSSMLWWMIYFMDLKRRWHQPKSTQGHPEVRKEAENGDGDASRTPSISFALTKQDINKSVNIYKEKFRNFGIDVIGHGVLQYTGEIIGSGRYSRVYAVKSKWPGHRVKVPLCVKCINNNRPTSVFQTCIEVMNMATLCGVPGVPRVVAVCLKAPPLIVMTRHSRFTLDVLLHKYDLSDLFLLEVCYQLCLTLDLIHRRKRIHNDLKGNNICVDVRATNHPKVTLIDYGLMTREGEKLFLTPATERERMIATAEHARRYPWYDLDLYLGGPASPQTDIYSLAVLLRQVMRVMHDSPFALLACVKEGHGKRSKRPPLTRFKAVLQTSIAALSKKHA
uniref:Protein kinase domain-containing protein n=1 Tax=Scylla olivacea TaxID=85551 RepID=A0A0P4WIA8_SCYOL